MPRRVIVKPVCINSGSHSVRDGGHIGGLGKGSGSDDEFENPLRVGMKSRGPRPSCAGCGGGAVVKARPLVELVDLRAFGRSGSLV
jgi:hypothetical protein